MTERIIDRVRVHPKVTDEAIMAAVEGGQTGLDNPGFCIMCGTEAEGVEPDARRYRCEACGAECVYGAEELMLTLLA